ncbi:MAG: DEAH-box RNA helicase prp16 [Alyxoria varia]|nr:MAG: DEAH-box RNA helicase prp16 [Alyxoria varia]
MPSANPTPSSSPQEGVSLSAFSPANNIDLRRLIGNFAPVARIMKTALPENAKIAKEAKECMQECVSEFISFITSEASEKCQQEKRKTVNGEDVLFAMTSLGFENYGEALKIYLAKYRETNMSRTNEQGQPGGQGRPSSGYGSAGPPMTGLVGRGDEEGPTVQSTQPGGGPTPGAPGEQAAASPSEGGPAAAPSAFGGTQEPNGTGPPPFPYAGAVMQNGAASHY